MRASLTLTLAGAWLAAILAAPAGAQAPADRVVVERVSEAVLRVQAHDCEGGTGSRMATAFLWRRADQAVTALHAVAGCARLAVYSEAARTSRPARLERVLRAADLALLALEEGFDLHPIGPAASPPALHQELVALGYALQAPTIGSKRVSLSFGSSRLRDMLPRRVADELARVGMPDLELSILRLEGTLLPGLSGAPIVDSEGAVVGVGDGGLEGGAAAISWAIPVDHVARLEQSTDAVPTALAAYHGLFAADLALEPGEELRCGDLRFRKLRTRPFLRLAETTDDPLALQQVIAAFGVEMADLEPLEFDIWVHEESGATFALPRGAALEPGPQACLVRDPAGFDVFVYGVEAAGLMEVQARSVEFENILVAAYPGFSWQLDPAWSYPAPVVNGKEGLIVRRKSAYGLTVFGQPAAYTTETLAARGRAFAALAVVNTAYDPAPLAACLYDPAALGCDALGSRLETWLGYVLGALLTTFPPT